jgi:hypothetical protein
MPERQILVGNAPPVRGGDFSEDPGTAWRVITWVGLALAVIAYADLGLALVPVRVGNPQWEFGTISRVFDSLPLATMATLLLFSGSIARGRKSAVRVVGTWSAVVGVMLLVATVLYVLTIPLALKAVTEPLAVTGLKKAIIKALIQGTVYPVVFLGMGVFGWRTPAHSRVRTP